jgi:hypothetical protein
MYILLLPPCLADIRDDYSLTPNNVLPEFQMSSPLHRHDFMMEEYCRGC